VRSVISTYRLQLHAGNTFADVAAAVPFLEELGISHLYLSPVLQARAGSRHGYDTVDVGTISQELGGAEGLSHLCAVAHEHGLGVVLDIVPNHLAIGDRANLWWWEVLAYGEQAPHAGFFDVDWRAPEPRIRGTIVLPVLDDHYGRALEGGAVRVVSDDDELFVVAVGGDLVLPLSPATIGGVLLAVASQLNDDVVGFAAHFLADVGAVRGPTGAARTTDVRAVVALARARLAVSDPDGVARAAVLARLGDDPVALDALLGAQAYRLARWQVAADELDYRRFLDVNSLVALRTEVREVFDATHRVISALVRDGSVDGLRVDHIDGMADPAGYCARLRALAPDAWLGVEKVLADGERLPPWPVDGTTGYDLAALTTPFLIDPRGEDRLTAAYQSLTGDRRSWYDHAVAAKEEVLRTLLGSDVARLVELLVQICESRRRVRDFTRVELRAALIAVASHTAAYRSYMRWTPGGQAERSRDDLAYVGRSVRSARAAHPELDPELFELLGLVLGFGIVGAAAEELAVRFQQLTVSMTVKGTEDTALYRACRLLALDDVGHDPSRFSVSPDELHAWAGHTADAWPRTMLATSTHDMKRSEDVRARLAVLAEVPDELADAAGRVHARAASAHDLDGHTAWFLLQTVVGAWPAPRERLWPVLQKSFREAKLYTSWLRPDPDFEAAASRLLDDVLDDPDLAAVVEGLVAWTVRAGRANALALTTLRCTLPGLPDTYQGCDRWQLTLVDPDNRHTVDLAAHAALLRRHAERTPASCWSDERGAGASKQALLRELLHLRRRGRWAFGPYEAIPVAAAEPVPGIAYRRSDVVVVVPRFPLRGAAKYAEAVVEVPDGRWRDVCSGRAVAAGPHTVAALVADFPVTVLERER
jgi:(1->4)-alpha-D-glucan 1-alpha-D-glucosylmutase